MTALWVACIALAAAIFLTAMPRPVRAHYRVVASGVRLASTPS
jgi:hypothetical protein